MITAAKGCDSSQQGCGLRGTLYLFWANPGQHKENVAVSFVGTAVEAVMSIFFPS